MSLDDRAHSLAEPDRPGIALELSSLRLLGSPTGPGYLVPNIGTASPASFIPENMDPFITSHPGEKECKSWRSRNRSRKVIATILTAAEELSIP